MQTLQAQTRECAVCGTFYPDDKEELTQFIQQMLKEAKRFPPQEHQRAIIVPHAGYVFSAPVAAVAYKTLHKKYKNIFLLGSSHHTLFGGVSVYNQGNYKTPLGEVRVNKTIVQELIEQNDFISYRVEAHTKEHTLEVQLPFLQYIYKEELQIIPIIMASSDIATMQKLAAVLNPYFEDESNLFVLSTDLSHYPSYEDAKKVDMRTLKAIESNAVDTFVTTIIENEKLGVANLSTSACGWAAIITMLYLTQEPSYHYEILEYKNSGDTPYGEKDRVVGYGAMRIYKDTKQNKGEAFTLNDAEKQELKELAKAALYEAVLYNRRLEVDPQKISQKLHTPLGAFVTLYKNGSLRGCIGRFEPTQPLYEVIVDMAISASRYDNRFTPVTPQEFNEIDIEISVLTPRQKADSVEDIVVGKHGIYVEYEGKSGTYLPQVATEMGWDKYRFFESCCQEKAGIPKEHCKDATLYLYEAIVF